MAEHGNFPSFMETSYKVPHHMDLLQQDGDKKVELGPSPSITAMSMNLFNNMKMLHKRKRTSPSFMSIREDRETSTTKTELRL